MSKTIIVTDSNSGILQGEAKELGIYVIPMPFTINDEEYLEEMRRQKELSEDYSIHHIKDESHKVDINVPSFMLLDLFENIIELR